MDTQKHRGSEATAVALTTLFLILGACTLILDAHFGKGLSVGSFTSIVLATTIPIAAVWFIQAYRVQKHELSETVNTMTLSNRGEQKRFEVDTRPIFSLLENQRTGNSKTLPPTRQINLVLTNDAQTFGITVFVRDFDNKICKARVVGVTDELDRFVLRIMFPERRRPPNQIKAGSDYSEDIPPQLERELYGTVELWIQYLDAAGNTRALVYQINYLIVMPLFFVDKSEDVDYAVSKWKESGWFGEE